jgi:hypothetical protein
MRRALGVAVAARVAASGCATSVSDVREADAGASSGKTLVFQRTALDPPISCRTSASGASRRSSSARSSNDRFFCSQFVLEAYRQSGLPLTDADPRWLSPRDILHMRDGDVPSVRVRQTLVYVGHLKFQAPSPAVDRSSAVQ